ncbi:MAG: DUF177 domain-containing protein [Clostridia bacterium]|nr:DUF177 domain-containing protein [Clostridia bacterium]
MNIDLRGVFSGKLQEIPIDEKYDFSDLEIGGIKPICSPVSVLGSVFTRAEVVTLEAVAEFNYKAPCDRCCTPTEKTFKIPINHIIVNSLTGEDESDFIVSENMELNLEDLTRSDIILGLPFLFLCKEDCKGICPKCGKNLNSEECICKPEVDERWAKLSEFYE